MDAKTVAAPINLVEYFVTKLEFEQECTFVPPADASQIIYSEIDTSYHVLESQNEPLKWIIQMTVASTPKDKGKLPYNFAIKVEATVEVSPTWPEKYRDVLVNINGNSLVYGICREKVRQVCSHGKYKPVLIPAIRFTYDKTPEPKVESSKTESTTTSDKTKP